jgi:hypothetical protein
MPAYNFSSPKSNFFITESNVLCRFIWANVAPAIGACMLSTLQFILDGPQFSTVCNVRGFLVLLFRAFFEPESSFGAGFC